MGPCFTHSFAGTRSYSLSEENWRYIKYANGEEELYNIKKDPFEWDNLISSQLIPNT